MISPIVRPVILLVCLCPLGCGAQGDLAGNVTFEGKPVPIGSVIVHATDSSVHTATIAEGRYSLTKVPAGAARIAVVSIKPLEPRLPMVDVEGRMKNNARTASTVKWFPLPDRFKDPATSGIGFDIRPGENQFDLTLTK